MRKVIWFPPGISTLICTSPLSGKICIFSIFVDLFANCQSSKLWDSWYKKAQATSYIIFSFLIYYPNQTALRIRQCENVTKKVDTCMWIHGPKCPCIVTFPPQVYRITLSDSYICNTFQFTAHTYTEKKRENIFYLLLGLMNTMSLF